MGKKKDINKMFSSHVYEEKTHEPKKVPFKILIVCEGDKTEPEYFKSFKENDVFVINMDTDGGKINTIQVVEKAIKLRDKNSSRPYDRVWAVFDKDDFPAKDFNDAIIKAQKENIGCAWSNESFELWYLLHFCNVTTAITRKDYIEKLNENIRSKDSKFKYEKNNPNMRKILSQYGNETQAIKFAKTLTNNWEGSNYASQNPATTVYKLVEQLLGFDKALIDELKADMEDH
ncbi:MAG: RloB family protein [Paludibacteraceae bacterium]|nr:RloB family protein [Paludibacteraceae bacterium]